MIALALAAWLGGCAPAEPACDTTWPVAAPGGATASVCVRVATRDDDRRRGLRGAPPLAAGHGLVLDYPTASMACVSMEGMDQPLDVLFLADDGRVMDAACGLAPGAPDRCHDATGAVLERAPQPGCPDTIGGFAGPPSASADWLAAPPPPLPPCDDAGPATVAGHLILDVVRHPSVDDVALQRVLGGASRWWGARGLWLRMAGPPATVEQGPVLVGIRHEIREALAAAGLDGPSPTPEQAEQARSLVLQTVVAPLKAVLAERATPYRMHTAVVVVLPEIGAPGSVAETLFERLRGLTFSPWLRGRVGPEEAALYELLDLPERFTPVVFVGSEPLAELSGEVDVTLAHELGHAMGLPHVAGASDLMADTIHRCAPGLHPEQAEQLMGYARHREAPAR